MKVILESGSKLREDILDLFDEIEPLLDQAREEFDTEPFERLVNAASSVVRKAREDYERPGTGAGHLPFCVLTLMEGSKKIAIRIADVMTVESMDDGGTKVGICPDGEYALLVKEDFDTVISRLYIQA